MFFSFRYTGSRSIPCHWNLVTWRHLKDSGKDSLMLAVYLVLCQKGKSIDYRQCLVRCSSHAYKRVRNHPPRQPRYPTLALDVKGCLIPLRKYPFCAKHLSKSALLLRRCYRSKTLPSIESSSVGSAKAKVGFCETKIRWYLERGLS